MNSTSTSNRRIPRLWREHRHWRLLPTPCAVFSIACAMRRRPRPGRDARRRLGPRPCAFPDECQPEPALKKDRGRDPSAQSSHPRRRALQILLGPVVENRQGKHGSKRCRAAAPRRAAHGDGAVTTADHGSTCHRRPCCRCKTTTQLEQGIATQLPADEDKLPAATRAWHPQNKMASRRRSER